MNKVLVIINVPFLEREFDMKIPIGKKIGVVKKVIIDVINEMTNNALGDKKDFILYDSYSGKTYDNNIYVNESDIVNGTKLIMI